ncbi:MAG: hypothetical protein V2A73_11190 [Pseudomonadota bacterium]
MSRVYQRGGLWWIDYLDADGTRHRQSTKIPASEPEAKAAVVLSAIEEKIVKSRGPDGSGPLTLARYFKQWIAERRAREVGSVLDDESRIKRYALPTLGHLLLADVRPHHIRDLVRSLKAVEGSKSGKPLAPRTIRHVYGLLHVLFHDAVSDEFIPLESMRAPTLRHAQKRRRQPWLASHSGFYERRGRADHQRRTHPNRSPSPVCAQGIGWSSSW